MSIARAGARAVGEFKAIDELMAEAAASRGLQLPARGRDPAAADRTRANGASTSRRSATRRAARWMASTRCSSAPARSKAGARCSEYFRFLQGRGAGLRALGTSSRSRRRSASARRGAIEALYALSGEDILVVGAISTTHRHQRLADGAACRGQRRVGLSRDDSSTYNQLPWRMLVPQRRRQPAGRRPLRVDDARGPVGRARQRRLLRDGPGRRRGGRAFAPLRRCSGCARAGCAPARP